MTRLPDAAVHTCMVPLLVGLDPLRSVGPELLTLLARLTSSVPNMLYPEELVPEIGDVSTADLDGHTPAELTPGSLLGRFGLLIDESHVVMAVSDTFGAWDDHELGPGMMLTRAYRRLYLFEGSLEAWPLVLDRVAAGVVPDLIICTEARWAAGFDNDTGEVAAISRW